MPFSGCCKAEIEIPEPEYCPECGHLLVPDIICPACGEKCWCLLTSDLRQCGFPGQKASPTPVHVQEIDLETSLKKLFDITKIKREAK